MAETILFSNYPVIQFKRQVPAGPALAGDYVKRGVTSTVSAVIEFTFSPTTAMTIPWEVMSESTAVDGVDYTISTSNPISVGAGARQATIDINVLDDGKFGQVKKLFIKLGSPTNATAVGRSVYTLQIGHNVDPPTLDGQIITVDVPENTTQSTSLDTVGSVVARDPGTVRLLFSPPHGEVIQMSVDSPCTFKLRKGADGLDDPTYGDLTIPAGVSSVGVNLSAVGSVGSPLGTIMVVEPANNTRRNVYAFSHNCGLAPEGSDPARDETPWSMIQDGQSTASTGATIGYPSDIVFGCIDPPSDHSLNIKKRTGLYLEEEHNAFYLQHWPRNEVPFLSHRAENGAHYGCYRKSFSAHFYSTDIADWGRGGPATCNAGTESSPNGHLFAVLVKNGSGAEASTYSRLVIINRSQQGSDQGNQSHAVNFRWGDASLGEDPSKIVEVHSSESLDDTVDTWNFVNTNTGWAILWLRYAAWEDRWPTLGAGTDHDNDGDVLNALFFPVWSPDAATNAASQAGTGCYMGAAHFEIEDGSNDLGMSSISGFQVNRELSWYASDFLAGPVPFIRYQIV